MTNECNICGSEETFKLIRWDHNIDLIKCKQCKTIAASDLPSDQFLDDYYDGFSSDKSIMPGYSNKMISLFCRTNMRN